MDIKTVIRVLDLMQPQLSEQDYLNMQRILRKEYLMDEIQVREEYLSRKVKKADIARQFEQELPKLKQQLAAFD